MYHGECDNNAIFCTKSFLKSFKGSRASEHFSFICPDCRTKKEHNLASSTKDQIAALVKAVADLSKEVRAMKAVKLESSEQNQDRETLKSLATEIVDENVNTDKPSNTLWSDTVRAKKVRNNPKATVCIKSDCETPVDVDKVKEIVTTNGIQVSKVSVNSKNGDLYIDLPTNENRDRIIPLLNEESLPGSKVIRVKEKCPTVAIRNVPNYTDEEEFKTLVKVQNPLIKDEIEKGETFEIVFTKEQHKSDQVEEDRNVIKEFMVVIRVSDEIRKVIKNSNNKVFLGFTAHHVTDRFYVKCCTKCHRYGHYHADCKTSASCGYCWSPDHQSSQCPIYKAKKPSKYKCINCHDNKREHSGHSSHWNKCPTYLELQKKLMKTIPYYSKN